MARIVQRDQSPLMDIDKEHLKKLIRLLLADCRRLQTELAIHRIVCAGLRDRVPEIDELLQAVDTFGTVSEAVDREYAQRSAELLAILDAANLDQQLMEFLKTWKPGTVQ